MRVHGNQISSNIELNGLYGAAEAKLAAERTRKKLMSAALAGEYDDCVVSLSGEGAPGDQSNPDDAQQNEDRQGESTNEDENFSGWA